MRCITKATHSGFIWIALAFFEKDEAFAECYLQLQVICVTQENVNSLQGVVDTSQLLKAKMLYKSASTREKM